MGSWHPAPGPLQEGAPVAGSTERTFRVFEPRVPKIASGPGIPGVRPPHASASGTAGPRASVRARARSPAKDRTFTSRTVTTSDGSSVTARDASVPPVDSS